MRTAVAAPARPQSLSRAKVQTSLPPLALGRSNINRTPAAVCHEGMNVGWAVGHRVLARERQRRRIDRVPREWRERKPRRGVHVELGSVIRIRILTPHSIVQVRVYLTSV